MAACRSRALGPVVDRVYGIGQIVEAHRYVESGRKRGSVVVAVECRENSRSGAA